MDSPKPSPPDVAVLRDVIARQFVLHELNHLPLPVNEERHGDISVPRAHTLADIYKCLHQGEFGVGHSIENPHHFGNQLAYELLRAGCELSVPVVEDVSLDKRVFRINLAPYRELFKGDDNAACALLLRVCLNSASVPRGSIERFLATLERFREMNKAHELKVEGRIFVFPPSMVDQFLSEVSSFMESYGTVPVLSHSPIYKELNSPSYRVADIDSLEDSPLAFLVKEVQ